MSGGRESAASSEEAPELEIPLLIFHELINTSSINAPSVLNVMVPLLKMMKINSPLSDLLHLDDTLPVRQAILSINMCRDAVVFTLRSQAKILSNNQVKSGSTENFIITSEIIVTSFQQLMTLKDQLNTARRTLKQCSNDCGLLERIEDLKREVVMDKMGELNRSNCNCSLE